MSYLLSNCRLTSLQDIQVQSNLSFFSCGDKDLDEFFQSPMAESKPNRCGGSFAKMSHTPRG